MRTRPALDSDRQAEAFAHESPRLAICEGNLRNGNLNRPPQVFLEIDGEDIQICDTVLNIAIRRPHDGRYARVNLVLSASHDGNKVRAILQCVGTTKEFRKEQQAHFVWNYDDERQSYEPAV